MKIYDIRPPIKKGDIIHLNTEEDIYDYQPPKRIIDLRPVRYKNGWWYNNGKIIKVEQING